MDTTLKTYVIMKDVGEYHPNYVICYVTMNLESATQKLKYFNDTYPYPNPADDLYMLCCYNNDEEIHSMRNGMFAQRAYQLKIKEM